MMNEVQDLLRSTFRTSNALTIPISGTGSAGMEAAICDFIEAGDLSPAALVGEAPASTVTFMIGTQTIGTVPLTQVNGVLTGTLANVRLREPTPFGTAPTGQMAPGPHIVTAVFGEVNPNFIVNDATTKLTISKEDAVATYTGAVFASTACVSCNTATVSHGNP